jgi:hypothetical protein
MTSKKLDKPLGAKIPVKGRDGQKYKFVLYLYIYNLMPMRWCQGSGS